MKLYTEEAVLRMLEVCRDTDLYEHILTFEDILKTEYPIELPSDEEIYIEAQNKKDNIKKLPFDSVSFQFGAMWLRDKIGGNK
jgi:hypothetical protein